MPTVQIITEIEDKELWSRIWGSEPQAFGSWWRNLSYAPGSEWDTLGTHGAVTVGLENPDDEDKTIITTITLDKIVAALNDPKFPSHLRQHIMDDNADCIDSDAVIQFIVFGEIVYG